MLAFICGTILVVFGWHMYPVVDGDAFYFIPTMKTYALTGNLDNKLINFSYELDPKGLGRFLFYVPAFPYFIGKIAALLGRTSYKDVVVILAVVRAFSLIVFVKTMLVVVHRLGPKGKNILIMPLALLLIISNAFFLFATNGRPEILSILVISVALFAETVLKIDWLKHLAIQVCIGILFPISLANGFIALSFYLFYIFFQPKSIIQKISLVVYASLIALIFLVLSYFLSGVDIQDGIAGLREHSRAQLLYHRQTGLSLLLKFWGSFFVFVALALLDCTLSVKCHFSKNKVSLADKLWLLVSLFIVTLCLFVFGLRAASIRYNYYAFLPLYQILSLRFLIKASILPSRILLFICNTLFVCALLLSLIEPIRVISLFPYYIFSGSTYSQMHEAYEQVNKGTCSVVYTPAAAMLDEEQIGSQYLINEQNTSIVPTIRMKNEGYAKKCIISFVQESNSLYKMPSGLALVADHGDHSPYTSLMRSLKLLSSPKGYSFKAFREDLN